MTKSTITREQAEEAIDGLEGLISRGVQSVYLDIAIAGLRQLVPAMDQKPALHRYRRKAVEPYGPYPWHYEVFVDYPQPFEDIEDEYFYAAPPVVTGFAVDGESECLPLDYLQGHKDGLEWAAQLAEANHPETGDWLYDDPIELAKAIRKGPDMPPVQPVADSEPDRNPVLAYADSYRDMAKQGVESVPIWSVITDLERNIAPLYRHAQPATVVPVVPVENHIGSKNALDAIVSFIKGKSNPTVKCYEEVSEQLFKDNCHGIHSHVIEYILKLGEELEDLRAEQAEMQPVPVVPVCTCRSGDGSLRWPCPVHPGSSPVIPDTWIPVSERLPENKPGSYEYLVFETLNNRVNHDYWNVPDKGDDEFTPFWNYYGGHVTHWMPLPAEPQEVKSES